MDFDQKMLLNFNNLSLR